MTMHAKATNAWKASDEAYVKVAGVWRPASHAYAKVGGAWKQAWMKNDDPPSPPSIIADNVKNQYLEIQVRLTDAAHDANLKRIRVFVTTGSSYQGNPLSTGTGYHAKSAVAGGKEPFSEFWYNGHGGFPDNRRSNVWSVKRWTRSLPWKAGLTLANNQTYRISAFAESANGIWSAAAYVYINTPKTPPKGNTASRRQINFEPLMIGTVNPTTGIFTEGIGEVAAGKSAVLYYGDRISAMTVDTIEITDASLMLKRMNDAGQPQAELDVAWTNATLAQLQNGSTKFQPGNLYGRIRASSDSDKGVLIRLGKNAPTAVKLPSTKRSPSSWAGAYRKQMTCIVIPLDTANSVQTFMQLYDYERYKLQGNLRLTQVY